MRRLIKITTTSGDFIELEVHELATDQTFRWFRDGVENIATNVEKVEMIDVELD